MDYPLPLLAAESGSFAYNTMKDRVPRILQNVLMYAIKRFQIFQNQFGEEGRLDCQSVIGQLSQLRSEIMTDKSLTLLDDEIDDCEVWNARFEQNRSVHQSHPTWFSSPWLYVECFMYRKIQSVLSKSNHMKKFDPFLDQKNLALLQSLPAMRNLAAFLDQVLKIDLGDAKILGLRLQDFLQVSLWGNRCDLSLSGGEESSQTTDPHKNLTTLSEFLLVDCSKKVFDYLYIINQDKKTDKVVDIILDNSGFELFTDLILAEFLLASKLATKIRFHPKRFPWFVSDVTPQDFLDTIDILGKDSSQVLGDFALRWKERLQDETFTLITDENLTSFWTLPDPFYLMKNVSPSLLQLLETSKLLIFKGDLNYRKLVSDLKWLHETSFVKALRGFTSTPLCSLRTLKAEVVVGLPTGVAESIAKCDADWMVTGKYAVIQSNI
uniref:LOW QUALITY PROTEIN: protein-glutamate O-methyltransferase-like n=1 Tax=Ciona intestinalis TaxID=7719 RepID=UPI000521B35E|nr:LOW QUALITY PROTEIN: protein-glutamate O-methyltransferase-like [Ciona intestinalis]|eukprot:XP_004225825.4 LOW QUALITY PROTEIN: protein-glutamate O-methyltransferase-like [Ciona intestinalis]